MKAEAKQQVIDWLQHKDYEAGVAILAGIRPQMARIMSGRSHRYQKKLVYELKKLVGEDHISKLSTTKPSPVVTDLVVEQPKTAVKKKSKLLASKANEEKHGFDLSAAHESIDEVPPEIEKIVKEHSRLFTLRSRLSEERYAVPQTNSDKNMKRRRVLTQSIHELSVRVESLFNAHSEYLKTRKMPDMEALFPGKTPQKPAPEIPTPDDLKRERSSLMGSNRRDKNKLEYQSGRKLSRQNPMPEGPKRTELIKRVRDRNKRIEQINKLLKK